MMTDPARYANTARQRRTPRPGRTDNRVELRLMGPPDQVDQALAEVLANLPQWRQHGPTLPNEKTPGVRIYLHRVSPGTPTR